MTRHDEACVKLWKVIKRNIKKLTDLLLTFVLFPGDGVGSLETSQTSRMLLWCMK